MYSTHCDSCFILKNVCLSKLLNRICLEGKVEQVKWFDRGFGYMLVVYGVVLHWIGVRQRGFLVLNPRWWEV